MKERPILFSTDMVSALLYDRKDQTRRVVKNSDELGCLTGDCPHKKQVECDTALVDSCPYGKVGDQLWVRETWFYDHNDFYVTGRGYRKPEKFEPDFLYFRADGECCQQVPECCCGEVGRPWKPSIHMPRWASRIQLEITGIRIEPLQAITEEDAYDEGIDPENDPVYGAAERSIAQGVYPEEHSASRCAFKALWESINGPNSWTENPWVWVVKFNQVEVPA